jgi:hypothetical protein
VAGSLNHIIGDDGKFRMDLIENLGDAHEALEECFELIVCLTEGSIARLRAACKATGHVDPYRTDRFSDEPMPKPMEGSEKYGSPWPLTEILRRLVDLGEYTLHDLNCDRHGHEVDLAAIEAAKAMLKRLGHPIE